MKKLLVCFHRGYLWLDLPYSVNAEIISVIKGLPNEGDDPAPYLDKKDTTQIKQKYNLCHAKRGFLIDPINNASDFFAMRILSCKVLNKMRPN